ncbi:hypothetical protein HPB52_003644 [Rhipicephalus sanguineus]|uniref:Uncharacterized protein n=1 Tax=Rhipicephalus sanguineus TaxID=34632 RepID=A0A9D4T5B5_RHISA|nr:hypothetical protein HPB52_003644 [Rhipicephalus sanguineus]
MSSSATASPPTHMYENFVALYPAEVWMQICRHLDIESFLNVIRAAPELKCLAFSPVIAQCVTADPQTDERTIRKFLQATRQGLDVQNLTEGVPQAVHVEELHFTNCLALSSDAILDFAEQCLNLRELYCVNCLVEPAELFALLSVKLTRVTRLEWSLHHKGYYESKLRNLSSSFNSSNAPQLRTMYVDLVDTRATVRLLGEFLRGCGGTLRNLHLHVALQDRPGEWSSVTCPRPPTRTVLALQRVVESMQHLVTYKYTCQLDMSAKAEPRIGQWHEPPCPFSRLVVASGNIDRLLRPADTGNVAWLADVLTQGKPIQGFEQAALGLEANSRAPCLFVQATAYPHYWNDITRLTLALTKRKRRKIPFLPIADRAYMGPMRQFFETCVSRIIELNVTAFHFAVECDVCGLVASTLPELRALALPPCGANHASSLASLAQGCTSLEHLDVRSSTAGFLIPSCKACELPLLFTRRSFGLLQTKTRLRRLSIDKTARIANLTFLLGCRVEELRLSVDGVNDEKLAQCPNVLFWMLTANPRLSSLTLVARSVRLSYRFAVALSLIRSLRHLCVLTTASHECTAAEDFCSALEVRLPGLRWAHVHYKCSCEIWCDTRAQASTWIRRRDCFGVPRQGASQTKEGVYLDDEPCMGRLCCADNFIGLVRPRNRY